MINFFRPFNYEAHAQHMRSGTFREQRALLLVLVITIASFSIPVNAQTFTTRGAWTYTIPAGVTRIQV